MATVLTVATSHAQRQDIRPNPEYEELMWQLCDPSLAVRDRAYAKLSQLDLSARLEITAALLDSNAQDRDIPLNPEYEKVVEQLGDPSFTVRQQAFAKLLEIGLPARAAVTAALNSPDREIRNRARAFVERFTPIGLGEYLVQSPGEIASLIPRHARELLDRSPKAESLMLQGLKAIDKDVARELAKFEGERLVLDGLESIDEDAARELASLKAGLGLSGLKFIDKDVAQELAKTSASSLSFDGLMTIDEDLAKELAKFEGERLSLNGLKFIDSRVARELLKFEGSGLSLKGLALNIGDGTQALEMIAGLGSPDAEIRSRARRIYEELPLPEYLLNTPIKIESLNARQAAQVVAKHPSLLFLSKLTVLDYFDPANGKNVARELAKHKGVLSLGGLEFIDVDVARELANMKGRLSLGGLKSINK